MTSLILRTNASAVYDFLCQINALMIEGEAIRASKILDCGAGGAAPPLTLFHQHGFSAYGIDISDEEMRAARKFCDEHGVPLHLNMGDMRHVPFADETFDYVYEHYSMCHLSKHDTTRSVQEMYRVLKKGGLCFLGVISLDTWPKSIFGEEREPGQFWGEEHGDESTCHSMFTDEEADQLVSEWEIVSKEKRVIYMRKFAEETTLDRWMELYREVEDGYTREAWEAKYSQRLHEFQYAHAYYVLRKPARI